MHQKESEKLSSLNIEIIKTRLFLERKKIGLYLPTLVLMNAFNETKKLWKDETQG